MTVSDFAKYVVDNMHRATLANALNIANKLDNPDYYSFTEFVKCLNDYVTQLATDNLIDTLKCSKILVVSSDSLLAYNSNIKYNKMMIIDNYIIDLWRIFQ